jgi:hypothetical protein
MLKITRAASIGEVALVVSGRVGAEHLPDLHRAIEVEPLGALVLDLNEVSIVDVQVVRFLLRCELQGIRITHCPAYIREWMAREK